MAYETLLKNWGDPGVEWQDNWAFTKNEPLPAEWGNYLINNLITDVQHLVDLTNAIDPDNDGQVADAQTLDGLSASQIAGFNYVQIDKPTGTLDQGETWYKPTNGLLYVQGTTDLAPAAEVGYQDTDGFDSGYEIIHESPVERTELDENGYIKLIDETAISYFNSLLVQNDSTWTQTDATDDENISLQNTVVHDETYSYVLESDSEIATIGYVDSLTERDFEWSLNIDSDTTEATDHVAFEIYGSTGTSLGRIVFHDASGEVEWQSEYSEPDPVTETYLTPVNETVMASWTAGQSYDLKLNFTFAAPTEEIHTYDDGSGGTYDTTYEFTNDTVEIVIDGVSQGTYELPIDTGYTQIDVRNKTDVSLASRSLYFDAPFYREQAVIDSIDWDWDETTDLSNVFIDGSTTIEGSRTPYLHSESEDVSVTMEREHGIVQNINAKLQISTDTGNISDFVELGADDDTGDSIGFLRFNDAFGTIEWHEPDATVTELSATWNPGFVIEVKLDFDFDTNQVEVFIDGVSQGTYSAGTRTNAGQLSLRNYTLGSNDPRSVYFDSLSEDPREFGEAVIVSQEPDKGIQNWDVLEYVTDYAGETITVDVEDEAGNVLISGIQSFDDLSSNVTPDINFRLRVHFSRDNVANHPKFKGMMRRWALKAGDSSISKPERKKIERDAHIIAKLHNR
jgi:hypothetical protein